MAVVKAPLMSLDATDSLGKAITFSKWKGRNYVRKLVRPANPRSGLQVGMRSGFRFNSTKFAGLTTTNKANWLIQAKKRKITALGAMQSFNQVRLRQNKGPVNDPTTVAGAVEAAPTAVAATAQPKSVVITWVDSVGAADFCTFIYMSTTTGFTADVSNLIAVIAHGVQTFTKPKLTTGTPYYFLVGGSENGGTLGTRAAQVTATPT